MLRTGVLTMIVGGLISPPAACQKPDARELARFSVPQSGSAVTLKGAKGFLWLRQTSAGIVVMARLPGRWSLATVNLTVKFADQVPMPPVAWSNQHGEQACGNTSETANAGLPACRSWEAAQIVYRAGLTKLFERRWVFSPGVPAGRSALPYGELDARLTRAGFPFLHRVDLGDAAGFEIPIGWAQLPPVNALNISKVFLAFDVAEGAQRRAGFALQAIDLPQKIEKHWSDCDYPLNPEIYCDQDTPGWYFLQPETSVRDVFILANKPAGNQNFPDRPSPEVEWFDRFTMKLSGDETVCGPPLRYRVGGRIFEGDGNIGQRIETHRLPGGDWLITSGPEVGILNPFGTGQCGSCPAAQYSVYHLDRNAGLGDAFDWSVTLGNIDQIEDADIQRSADWNTMTVYQEVYQEIEPAFGSGKGLWSSQRFCLRNGTYEACGAGPGGAPPEPRRIRWAVVP